MKGFTYLFFQGKSWYYYRTTSLKTCGNTMELFMRVSLARSVSLTAHIVNWLQLTASEFVNTYLRAVDLCLQSPVTESLAEALVDRD